MKNSLQRKRIAGLLGSMVHGHLAENKHEGLEDIAAEVKVTKGYLSNMITCGNGAGVPSDVGVILTRCLGRYDWIEGVAAMCGGRFVRIPCADGMELDGALGAAAKAAKESGEAIAAALDALADNRITDDELATCDREIPEAITALEQVAAAIRVMHDERREGVRRAM